MGLARFLVDLFEHGHVRLDAEQDDDARDQVEAERVLSERERLVADDFPGDPPTFDLPTALWFARRFHLACRFVLFRDDDFEQMLQAFEDRPANEASPTSPAERHYAVDLVGRFLPDLDRLTSSLSPSDPLRGILRNWGAEWPWSSVGMKGIEPKNVDVLTAHPGLRTAYVDRIVRNADASRLRDPVVRDQVHAALGAHRVRESAWCNVPASDASLASHNIPSLDKASPSETPV